MPLRDLLPGLRSHALFEPLRNGYLRTFRRRYWNYYVAPVRRFYAHFIRPDALVFDVGANIGEFSRIFLHLGARVIAVEPTPRSIAELKLIHNGRLTVAPVAIADRPGILPLYVSDCGTLNSLCSEWTEIVGRGDKLVSGGTIDVPVTTLDKLQEKYGAPEFIKIDVEGYELQALKGLSRYPPALSFEFTGEVIERAIACLEILPAEDAIFNYVVESPHKLELSEWVTRDQMKEIVAGLKLQTYGDIFMLHGDVNHRVLPSNCA